MRRSLFFLILSLILPEIQAQDKKPGKNLTIDYQLLVENDVFTLNMNQDQYYSSGIYPQVRILQDSLQRAKVIQSYQLNHRIYTPSWIGWTHEEQLDRPYAGILSVSIANEYYYFSNQYLKVQVELGWLGPGSGVGKSQETWHRWFGMPTPRGWKYQINDSPILNLNLTYIKPLVSTAHFELSGESNAALGTVYNYVHQDVVFRLGELKPIHQSAYVASSLGNPRVKLPEPKVSEIYFFYSPGIEYVFYNATIQGNIMGTESEYTDKVIRWVWQHRAGIMLSWPRFDLGIIAYWRTHENAKANDHNYVGIRLNQRF